ncbi:MAG: divalent-cation tolerance protein CutA [Candidatus Thermoplasmatota archaeon]|nr:divalent-cation tolerance protein CutA [Candidatus Thermoplasmatota archaeon]MBU1941580.1 divalent-cation tolerance protein CutA [Candidatus Thermoplasmatota archaeon]
MMITIIFSTVGSVEEAKRIGRYLVKHKLVACVNIIPMIHSIYRWNGKMEEGQESILLAKTTEALIEKTIKTIKDNHSYEVPDIITLSVTSGLESYLKYIMKETQ